MKKDVKFLHFNCAESFNQTNLANFPELEGLLLDFNDECRVDLSANPKLLYFKAKGIDCYSLDFSKNKQLKRIVLHSTGIMDVNLDKNIQLKEIVINNCPYLTYVDLSSNEKLDLINVDESINVDLPGYISNVSPEI